MKINNKKKLIKYMFLYRSFIFKFTKFETDSKDPELLKIIELLNIKNKYQRIYNTIDSICDYIDIYFEGNSNNYCKFKNNICICYRKKNIKYENGCCRRCLYQTNKGCPTKNFACKMFNCSYVKDSMKKVLTYDDIILLKVLSIRQQSLLKYDYYSTIEEVSRDLWYPSIISLIRIDYRTIKRRISLRRKEHVSRNNKRK